MKNPIKRHDFEYKNSKYNSKSEIICYLCKELKERVMSYKQEVQLSDNEKLLKVNLETGEYKEIEKRISTIPKGKSVFKFKFTKLNQDMILKMRSQELFSMEEIGVICYMSSISEYNTNSLKPLNNDTSLRELEDYFGINKNKIKKLLTNLYNKGVYLQLKVGEIQGSNEYWVLNPWISWKGKLVSDSIFDHFKNTLIAKLIS